MKRQHLRFGRGFRVGIGNRRSQSAEMVLVRGGCEGGPDNRHRGADQWLFVVSGSGEAIVDGRRHRLDAGSLVFIQRREKHQVRNTGRGLLRTLNFYVPPAYRKNGDPLARGRK